MEMKELDVCKCVCGVRVACLKPTNGATNCPVRVKVATIMYNGKVTIAAQTTE